MFLVAVLASQTWTMVVGGDIMLNAVTPSEKVFAGVTKFASSADIATANLEIPLTKSTSATSRKTPAELKAKKQFILKADPRHASWIAKAGFDLVGLGNNHAMDYGQKGLDEMTAVLDKQSVAWCGAGDDSETASSSKIVTLKSGVKVAFVSFLAFITERALWKCTYSTPDTAGVSTLLHLESIVEQTKPKAKGDPILRATKAIVRKAREQADVVVVWLHWGTERKTVPDPYQVKLGRAFVEAGADCVLGAHPHVLQGAEIYAGRPIFYSLGNLVSPLPASTALFKLSFAGNTFKSVEMLPCDISAGKIVPVAKAKMAMRQKTFNSLSATAVKKFKHSKSVALTVD